MFISIFSCASDESLETGKVERGEELNEGLLFGDCINTREESGLAGGLGSLPLWRLNLSS